VEKPVDRSRTLIAFSCRSVALSLRSSFITRIYVALRGRNVPDGITSDQYRQRRLLSYAQ
jgi:hypothetical protein